VEIGGTVRAVTALTSALDIEIASGGNRIHVFRKRPSDVDPQNLVGARIRARGVVAASFNAVVRHLLSVVMFVTATNDFVVEQLESTNPFDKEIIPLSGIAEYRRDIQPGQRVHLKGVVTLQRPGEDLFLQDASGGLQVRTRQAGKLKAGDVVDVVGFPDLDHFLPVLDDAIFRKTSETRVPAMPNKASIGDIQKGKHHADLITLQAKLLERTVRQSQTTLGSSSIALLR
jgi:hypothetical protein